MVRVVSAYPCGVFLRYFSITPIYRFYLLHCCLSLILNRVGLLGFKHSWIITFMNVKIRSITWTLYSSRQVYFLPVGTCSNVNFIFSCPGFCIMLGLERPYRSTSIASGHFCWHKMGNFSPSVFPHCVLWLFSFGCSKWGVFSGFWLLYCVKNCRSKLSNPCLLNSVLLNSYWE